jgi:hypothetical protein
VCVRERGSLTTRIADYYYAWLPDHWRQKLGQACRRETRRQRRRQIHSPLTINDQSATVSAV